VSGVRGGGWKGDRCRRGGVKIESMFPSVEGLSEVRAEEMSLRLWLRLQVLLLFVLGALEVDLVLFGSWERRRRRPDTAYCTGYAK
jgi:hypothetical protein